ncbi:MAG: glycine cleavage system protein GcvH [Chloroflexaceae bacterium]|nr:glycine cleavage system protein GcvH [Chloroflexaceae bacterium]NJL33828.1 glycine cleavage system protein GcvH [Chloroflexaceae bacterium]NJO04622.1 glycine cleavage system protein GcvH [Chloroflexaceae bacterium]
MSFNTPAELKYAKTHEWLRVEGDEAVVGITDYAQHALGDVVYLELPEVGATFAAGAVFGVIESVKASSDLYAPVDMEIVGIHDALIDDQEPINADPYGNGWMLRIKPTGSAEHLLDAAAYEQIVEDASDD